MAWFRDPGPDCFLCRVMRSFGITGGGALLGGFGAFLVGTTRETAIYAALVGGLISAALMLRRRR